MQHSPVGMTLVDPDGKFIAANSAFCDMLGYTETELLCLDFPTITHPEDLQEDLDQLRETLAGRLTTYRMRKRYLHKDGHPVATDLSVTLLRDDDGQPVHFIGQILDMSEQEAQAQRLSRAQRTIDHQRRMAEAVYDYVI